MSEVIVDSLKHSGNSGTANLTLASSGNVEARKFNGCERIILEQFFTPCDGSVIATSAGNITVPNVTSIQDSTGSHDDLSGSNITYTPPTGTTQVIYEYIHHHHILAGTSFCHYKLSIGGTEVTDARRTEGHEVQSAGTSKVFKWGFNIGGTANAATGRQASWTSGKELKWEWRHYTSGNDGSAHRLAYWDGADITDVCIRPSIGITAIG
tara:strand:+ start:9989 stop:10618 length:630 start_codon:yes stop_codon:yes gene_type:complete